MLAAYLAFMALSHFAAAATMDRVARGRGIVPRRVEVLPEPFNPLRWRGFAEDEENYWQGTVGLGRDLVDLVRIPKGPLNGPVARAAQVGAVKTFLWFARFPVVSLREENGRHVVEYRDLRFAHSLRRRPPFLLRVVLSQSGSVERVLFNP